MKKKVLTTILLGSMFLGGCKATTGTPEPTLEPIQTAVLQETLVPVPTAEPTQMPTQALTQTPVENQEFPNNSSKKDNILFADNQWYAVAYLGYETIEDMEYYLENYLDDENLPTCFFSEGEYYLIIPRHDDMQINLYQNDMETMEKILEQEVEDGKPFILQCNVSDIFSDVTVEFSFQGETVEFSPYISLKDGSVQVGDRGLNITKQCEAEESVSQTSSQTEDGRTILTEEEIKWFNEEFFNADGEFRRNNFLNCAYENVRAISIYDVFYNSSEEISAEEKAALRGSEIDFGTDFFKLTTSYMDDILREYMNVSFEEINKVDLDYYLYLEEFDAYFACHGDTNYSGVEVKSGEKDENGNVKLQYLRSGDGKEYIVTLKAHDNGYYFVSNCEIE